MNRLFFMHRGRTWTHFTVNDVIKWCNVFSGQRVVWESQPLPCLTAEILFRMRPESRTISPSGEGSRFEADLLLDPSTRADSSCWSTTSDGVEMQWCTCTFPPEHNAGHMAHNPPPFHHTWPGTLIKLDLNKKVRQEWGEIKNNANGGVIYKWTKIVNN